MKPVGTQRMRLSFVFAAAVLTLGFAIGVSAADPQVGNVRAVQRPGTQLVDINYSLSASDTPQLTVTLEVSGDGGRTYAVPALSLSGAVGIGVRPGNRRVITWDAGRDWPGRFSGNFRFKVIAHDRPPYPAGMVLIPGWSFTMGDSFNEGAGGERPTHTVYVSAFYMDRCEVTKGLWDEVYQWAVTHRYSFDNAGSGKAADHPVQTVSWYDVVKWCNARSEREGLVPAYYISSQRTTPYRSGQLDIGSESVKWDRGYRLPTEAEWEKAARAGLNGRRFPDGDTITHKQANYYSQSFYPYDISDTRGYHPAYRAGAEPYTSPVAVFPANGYGLYDMAGNVWEWCWDLYGGYLIDNQSNPRGGGPVTTAPGRVFRGGSWASVAMSCRAASRFNYSPGYVDKGIGFRSVLPPNQK